MKQLAIIGASGHGKVVADIAEMLGWQISFFDDNINVGSEVEHWPIKGTHADLLRILNTYDGFFVAIGQNEVRLALARKVINAGGQLVSIVHPHSQVSQYTKIGRGTVIMPGAIVNAFSTTGLANIINTSASVDHDCKLSDGVHVSPGASIAGGVNIGEASWVGIGCSIREGVSIGSNVIIGAGAAVISDVASNATAVGVPAKISNTTEQ